MYPRHMPEGISKQPSLVMERLDEDEKVIRCEGHALARTVSSRHLGEGVETLF